MNFKKLFLIICFVCLFTLMACDGTKPVPPDNPDKPGETDKPDVPVIVKKEFTVSESSLSLEFGAEKEIKVTKSSDFQVVFSSNNEKVATVDQNGNVTATGIGEAKITIKIKDQDEGSKEVDIIVKKPTIIVNFSSKMKTGETQNLEVTSSSLKKEEYSFSSSNEAIAKVDEFGTVSAISSGNVEITVTGKETKAKTTISIEIETAVVKPERIEISANVDTIYLDTPVKLTATVYPLGASQEVIWSCPNSAKGSIDEEGNVTILKDGKITIRCVAKEDENIKAAFTLDVSDTIDPEAFFNRIHQEHPLTQRVTAYGWGPLIASQGLNVFDYDQILAGGVTLILWTELTVNELIIPNINSARPGTKREVRYVTVHDTATTHSHAHAYMHANNLYSTTNSTSWHYSIGPLAIWHQVPDNEVAHHAGDGTKTSQDFYDTGVLAEPGKPTAVVTVSDDGFWVINGIKTNQDQDGLLKKIPINKYQNGEWVVLGYRNAKNSDLPDDTGIITKVGPNGNYWIGKCWWSTSYQTLSNLGGNLNSIGIETMVNYGTDLYLTWATCAKMIGTKLLPQNNLGIEAVKQHNTFSGKNCPQAIREADLWPYFMSMVEAENTFFTKLRPKFTITFTTNNPDIVDEKGQIIRFPEVETEVTYTINIKKKDGSYEKTLTYTSVIPAMEKNHALDDGTDLYYYMAHRAEQK